MMAIVVAYAAVNVAIAAVDVMVAADDEEDWKVQKYNISKKHSLFSQFLSSILVSWF